jgi:polyhydroxybutyrate depolymerase
MKDRSLMRLVGTAAILALTGWGGSALAASIDLKGVARTYSVQFPDNRPAPLVIVLHGNTQTGADMVSRTSWPAVARRERFGVVFPDGLNRAWADLRLNANRAGRAPPEGTDDVGFIVALIEKFIADGAADPKRIYVTGLSNGGAMTMTMVCVRAELFAAAAAVIINFTDEMANACHPARPVPMLMINGTADPLIPYEGGRGTSRFARPGFWSTEKTFAFWRRVNGCEGPDADVSDLPHCDKSDPTTVTRFSSRCPPGRDAVLYRVNHGGHRMPGNFADARFRHIVDMWLGPQNRDIDSAELTWEFFRKFP